MCETPSWRLKSRLLSPTPHKHLYLLGVSRKSPTPIQPTDTDHPAPPLQPTDEANTRNQSAKGIPMPVRCGHQSWKSKTNTCQIEPIPACISFSTSRLLQFFWSESSSNKDDDAMNLWFLFPNIWLNEMERFSLIGLFKNKKK